MTLMMFMLVILMTLLMSVFFILSKKEKWEKSMATSFECGFSSYFFSRFSFSIHYFMIALLFLFLDLELCFIMPFFNQSMNSESLKVNMGILIIAMLSTLLMEWKEGKVSWNY